MWQNQLRERERATSGCALLAGSLVFAPALARLTGRSQIEDGEKKSSYFIYSFQEEELDFTTVLTREDNSS